MKKLSAVLALVIVLTLLLTAVSFACPPPPPPCPPPPPADCSPGFWKNHTFWMADYDDAGWMLDALKAKGNSPLRQYRWEVTATLNAAYPDADCD